MSQDDKIEQDIFLNTENRDDGVNYNAAWNVDPRYIKSGESMRIALLEFSMKNLAYPTNSYNNCIYFEEKSSGTITTAIIPAGAYDITGYLTYLKAAMEGVSEHSLTYTCTYDIYTDHITIGTTQPFRFRYSKTSFTSRNVAYNQMGLDEAGNVEGANAALNGGSGRYEVEGNYPYVLNGSTTIAVATNLANGNYDSDRQSNTLAMLPVTVGYGETFVYLAQATTPVFCGQTDVHRFEMGLFDEYGNAYELPPNCPVTYRIRITNKPKSDVSPPWNYQVT